jgi:taurine dioxygenase
VIGAEIDNIDLSMNISDEQFNEITQAITDHLVIFFRDQHLNIDQHREFSRRFGELYVHPFYKMKDHRDIFPIKPNENKLTVPGRIWHSDVSASAQPPSISLLLMYESPELGGDTVFSSTYAAWETLSEPIQKMLIGLRALHSTQGAHEPDKDQPDFSFSHPVVRTHPITKKKSLFVNRLFTTYIEGLSPPESDAILQMLYRHIELDDFKCRFSWKPGSLAIWDNRCTQHYAIWDYYPNNRYGHRFTVSGEVPN